MKHKTTHEENLIALRRIQGQIKGIQNMIEDKRYCIDILTQIHASIHALYRVADRIFIKHIEHCVGEAFRGRSEKEKAQKIKEIMDLLKKIHKVR